MAPCTRRPHAPAVPWHGLAALLVLKSGDGAWYPGVVCYFTELHTELVCSSEAPCPLFGVPSPMFPCPPLLPLSLLAVVVPLCAEWCLDRLPLHGRRGARLAVFPKA